MPRRGRRYKSGELGALIGLILLLCVGGALVEHPAESSFLFAILVAVGAAVIAHRSRLNKRLLERVKVIARLHIDALARRRAQLVQPDAYGKPQVERWQKELEYFINNQVIPRLPAACARALQRNKFYVIAAIEQQVLAASADNRPFTQFSDDLTSAEYELFCAQVLRESGWDARVTKGSRDQGVDVIAEMNGVRVVIQCKLYTGAVGNKAVQEVSAGRAHERAHFGIVVSNSRSTAGAEALAKTNRILLLHHRDLPTLHRILEQWSASPARQTVQKASIVLGS
jgi:hypothetical protein